MPWKGFNIDRNRVTGVRLRGGAVSACAGAWYCDRRREGDAKLGGVRGVTRRAITFSVCRLWRRMAPSLQCRREHGTHSEQSRCHVGVSTSRQETTRRNRRFRLAQDHRECQWRSHHHRQFARTPIFGRIRLPGYGRKCFGAMISGRANTPIHQAS